jgi:hypothetical protein
MEGRSKHSFCGPPIQQSLILICSNLLCQEHALVKADVAED